MNKNTIIGTILIIAGVSLGLYVGVWLMFIGGIIQVIDEIRAENMQAMVIAMGIAKVVFAGFVGAISAYVLAIPGYVMVTK